MAWIKLLHVLCVISWMGSLITLSHFYGALGKEDPSFQMRLRQLLKRMYLYIDLPSMVLTVLFGGLLFIGKPLSFFRGGWFHMKMTFALLLIFCDLATGRAIIRAALPFKKKKIGGRILHTLIGLLLIGVLISIYIVRNKEQEILEKHKSVGKKGGYSYDSHSDKANVLKEYDVTT